jgi:hypothetical protein
MDIQVVSDASNSPSRETAVTAETEVRLGIRPNGQGTYSFAPLVQLTAIEQREIISSTNHHTFVLIFSAVIGLHNPR